MTIQLELFGGFSAQQLGVPITNFRSDKIRALLAYLTVEMGRPHRRESLATLFWPEMSDSDAKRNLRQSLYRLRQLIDLPSDWLLLTRQIVQLNHTYVECDVQVLREALAVCETHRHENLRHCASCRERLIAVTELYHGGFLAGLHIADALGFSEWQTLQHELFHQQILSALRLLCDMWLQKKEYAKALQSAQKQLALEAWREVAHRQALRALAGMGQMSQVKAQFMRCQEVLREELGVTVSHVTQKLYETLVSEAQDTPLQSSLLYNFPTPLTGFIGRKSDIAAILSHLAEPICRLLTIYGVGGMGKTRLAIQAADAIRETTTWFPDGLYFIPLAEIDHADQLVTTIGLHLGLTFAAMPEPVAQLQTFLQARNCLLVLDNFEHLNAAKQLLLDILHNAPAVTIIVTSRVTLNLHAEQRLPLLGLADAEGVQLFTQTARRTQPRFQLSAENQPALAEICTLTDGVPLAIEMAASWIRLLNCHQIAKQLATTTAAFLETRADLPMRHHSMSAIFDYSWQLLSEREQRTLVQLTVFRGGATLNAILSVTDATMFEVANLLDKSLLKMDDDNRYSLHAVLHQLAVQHFDSAEFYQSQHATYFIDFLHARTEQVKGGEQLNALNALAHELQNISAAWRFAVSQRDVALLMRGVDPLAHFCDTRSRFRLGKQLLQAAQGVISAESQPHAHISARLSWFYFQLGEVATGRAMMETALTQLNDTATNVTVFAHNYAGAMARHQDEMTLAKRHLHQAQTLAQSLDDTYGLSISLNILGQIALLEAQYREAEAFCRKSILLKRQIGDEWGMTFSLGYLGRIAQATGDFTTAAQCFQECLEVSRRCQDRRMIAFALENLGEVALAQGDQETATERWQQSLALYLEIGSQRDAARLQAQRLR